MKTPDIEAYAYKMMVTHNGNRQMIWYKDIICLKAEGDCTGIIVNHTNVAYTTAMSLHQLEQLLPSNVFFRCHRSAIVNIFYIESIDKANVIHTYSKMELPTARNRRHPLKKLLHECGQLKVPQCKMCEVCSDADTCTAIRPFTVHGIANPEFIS